jgi:uncharacterized protein YabE (DUF348 family)
MFKIEMSNFFTRELNFGAFKTPVWVALSVVSISIFTAISLLSFSSLSRISMVEQHGRLITIYDDGSQKTILSQGQTVADALAQAEIEVDSSDIIEPSLNSQLIASSYSINIFRSRPVVVVDGNTEIRVVTAAQTGKTIAQAANVDLYNEDLVEIGRETDILTGMGAVVRARVVRAVPVKLILYGQEIRMRTQAKTVAEFIEEKGLKVGDDDYVIPSKTTPVTPGMEIKIWREGINTVTIEEEIDFEVQEIQSNDHPVGFREVQTAGEKGKRSVTYEVEIRAGVEISRNEIQSIVLLEAKRQVEIVGIKSRVPAVPSNPGANAELGHRMMLEAGFGEDQWPCLYNLWMRESGWRTEAGNPYSGAYGIPQALPASKMSSAGPDYMSNPATQISWGLGYIRGRYSTPCGAWDHFTRMNWY